MFRYICFLLSWISLVGISSAGELPSWIGGVSLSPVDAQGFASVTLGGVRMNEWDSELWNVKDWHRINPS